MKPVAVKRMFRSSVLNFVRNGMVSLASVLVMTITLSVITGILFFDHILESTLQNVESKVNISVYFVPSSNETQILSIKDKVTNLPQVSGATYISEKQALQDFKDRHKDDQTTLQALDELDNNPIGAVLDVQAKDINQYETISKFITDGTALSADEQSTVDHVYYNKAEIDTINNILNQGRTLGFVVTLILMILSVIVTFNTIRLAIYFAREEISVMRLVGASRIQVKGPFVIEGALYGVVSTILTLLIFLPITYWFGVHMTHFFQGLDLFAYYLDNIFQFLIIIILFGMGLGALSSFFAVHRYLRV